MAEEFTSVNCPKWMKNAVRILDEDVGPAPKRITEKSNWELFQDVMEERNRKEKEMAFRHPWFNMSYNYLIAGLMIFLMVALFWWGVDVYYRRIADDQTATALAAQQEEYQAAEEARQAELAAQEKAERDAMEQDVVAMAKAFYGIHLFVEKYHYTEKDLETYARCMFNRYDANGGRTSLATIISREGQFTGYAERNTVLKENKDLATKFITEWREEDSKPCDLAYQCAELRPEGIYLVTTNNPGPYDRRWHVS